MITIIAGYLKKSFGQNLEERDCIAVVRNSSR